MNIRLLKIILALASFLLSLWCMAEGGNTDYVKDEKIYIVRGDNDFPPFEFINEKGEPDGFNVDFFHALMAETGLKYDLKLEAWDSVVYNFNAGKIDIITGTSTETEMERPVAFGIPYFKLSLDILSRKEDSYSSLEALKNKNLVIQKDSWTRNYVDSLAVNVNILYVDSIKKAIEDLSKGKYDAVICTNLWSKYEVAQLDVSNINIHKTHIGSESYSVLVGSEADSLLSVLNKGIYEMKLNGTFDTIYNKWFSEDNTNYFSSFMLWVVLFLLVVGVIMAMFIIVLRVKVARATKELVRRGNDLREKNKQLLQSFTAGHIIPILWNVKNDKISISIPNEEDFYGEFKETEGISLERMLLNIHPDDRQCIREMFFDVKNGKTQRANHEIRYDITGDFSDYFDIYLMAEGEINAAVPDKIIGYMQNITKRKKAEIALAKSEVFLKEILDAIPFPVHVKDVENGYKYTFWNKKSSEVFGDALFKDASYIMDNKTAMHIQEVDLKVYQTGEIYTNREDFTTFDGKEHHTIVQKSVIYEGGHRQVLIVRWDIGERLELQENLMYANKLNEIILNNATSGFAYITSDYKVQWENMSSVINHKQAKKYIPGQLCYKTVYGKDAPCEDCIMERAFREKTFQYKEMDEENGTIVKMVGNPVFNEKDERVGIVLRADDITKPRRLHEELRLNKEKAEQANRLKSAFLANMSHEIRTPLNAIVGFSELLKTADKQEERDEYGRIISANSDILLSLINDILDLSKIEAGCLELKNAHFDLSTMFHELEMTFKQRMQGGVKLICEVPFKNCIVNLDKKRITQVIINFTSNAIKFTKEGSITIGYSYQKGKLHLFVKDTGCGIKKDKLHRVFGRFEKLNDYAQGTGLGLAISKSIAEANGGTIGMESVENKGSIFYVDIPCQVITENVEEEMTQILSDNFSSESGGKDKKSAEKNEPTILVAEDNDSNYLLVNSILRKDFKLVRAVNGAEVLEQLQTLSPDIILMDIKMPILDGLETTRTIREMGLKMPIIAVTANAFDSDRIEALNAGCDDFLPKPLNKESLMACLYKYIQTVKQ